MFIIFAAILRRTCTSISRMDQKYCSFLLYKLFAVD